MYQSSQKWYDWLTESKFVPAEFSKALRSSEKLAFYRTEQNHERRENNVNTQYHLKKIKFEDLQPISGHLIEREILAGTAFYIPVEISAAQSIICLSFHTPDFSIRIGIFFSTLTSMYKLDEDNEKEVKHSFAGTDKMKAVKEMETVDASRPCKLNYIAQEPGFYIISLSNEKGWYNTKKLLYQLSVLKPAVHGVGKVPEAKSSGFSFMNAGSV